MESTLRLPDEIYWLITSFCSNVPELRLVSRQFRAWTTHRLVPSLSICYSVKEFARLQNILGTPEIWAGVKSLTWQAAVFDEFSYGSYCKEVHRQRRQFFEDEEKVIEGTLREGWNSYRRLARQQRHILHHSIDCKLLSRIGQNLRTRAPLESLTLLHPRYHSPSGFRLERVFSSTLLIPSLRPDGTEIWKQICGLNCVRLQGQYLSSACLLGKATDAFGQIQQLHLHVNTGEEVHGNDEEYRTMEYETVAEDLPQCQRIMDDSKFFQSTTWTNLVKIRFGFSHSVDYTQPARFRQVFEDVYFPKLRIFEVHNFSFDASSVADFFDRHRQTIRYVMFAYMCCAAEDSWTDALHRVRDLDIPWRSFVVYRGMTADAGEQGVAWCYGDPQFDDFDYTEEGLHSAMEEFVKRIRPRLEKEDLPDGSYF